MKRIRITALDRFDAPYIARDYHDLFKRNLSSAALSDRVRLAAGDIAAMPFPDATFDSAVSTNVLDLGEGSSGEGCPRCTAC
jgi:Methyltransferase domain